MLFIESKLRSVKNVLANSFLLGGVVGADSSVSDGRLATGGGRFYLSTLLRSNRKRLWGDSFLLLSGAVGLVACGGGGSSSTVGVASPRNVVFADASMPNTGTTGNDVFRSPASDFQSSPAAGFAIDGGTGFDELQLSGSGNINLSDFRTNIDSVEIINTEGGGNIALQLGASDVTSFSRQQFDGDDILILQGDSSEAIALADSGWSIINNGILQLGRVDYNLFENGNARIAVTEGRMITQGGSSATPLSNPQTSLNSNENNFLFGTDASETLRGSDGNDYIYGGNGHDTIQSNDGINTLEGGTGNDIFDFDPDVDGSIHTILDFAVGQDKIAFYSRSELMSEARQLTQGQAISESLLQSIVNEFINIPINNIISQLFDSAFSVKLLTNQTAIDGDSVHALEFITDNNSGRGHDFTVTLRGQSITAPLEFFVTTATIIPTEEFSNLADLQDGNITFNDFLGALGSDVLVYTA